MWLTPPGPYRATSRKGINSGSHNNFWPHKDMEVLAGWGMSSMPRPPPRQHKHERRYTPSTHPFRRIWKDDYDGQMIFGDLVGLKLPDICLTGEGKPPKNLTQKTCPDWGSNPSPLRERRACTACSTAVDIEFIWNTFRKVARKNRDFSACHGRSRNQLV